MIPKLNFILGIKNNTFAESIRGASFNEHEVRLRLYPVSLK